MSEILIINDQSVSVTDDEQMRKLEDELHAKVLIRTIDDENDSDYEDVDDDDDDEVKQIPIIKKDDDNQSVPKEKLAEKNQELLDDDNNAQSPAYVPRKGKFYEHDDRTFDDNQRIKSDVSKNKSRFYRDFDGKWQHDLYFQDQKQTKSHRSHISQNYNREQFHLNDYMSRPNHRQVPREGNSNRMTNFEFKDYHRNEFPKQQIDERTFHRRRNFTNSQFQQQDHPINPSKDNFPSKIHRINREFDKYDLKNNNLPPRLQSTIERPKRYSSMRNNPNQQQGSIAQISHSNAKEQNEWPQAPPPPTTSFLSQQLITPQMFYQQQTSRYVPLNYSQTSISDQFQANK